MKICLFLILLLKFGVSSEDANIGQCLLNEECQENAGKSKYSKEANMVNDSKEDSQKSPAEKCGFYDSVIHSDLEYFKKHKIKQDAINKISHLGTKYQIINNKLYRQKSCMFPSRCSGIEHFIKQLLPELPDMEIIINCRDWPQQHKNYNNYEAPVFSFSKTSDYMDVMYPAWSFWEGGPAISLYPTGIKRWDLHRDKITQYSDDHFPWNKKESKGFFRGSRTSDERDSLILLSRKEPDLINAQYTKNQAWKSPKDTLNAEPATEISFEEHCRYKYLFNFRGVAASFRFKHLFLCKSLVFHVGNEWQEFFYSKMEPWIHYIPLNSYPKENEIKKLVQSYKENDDLARQISENGFEFIWNHLTMEDILCYWRNLLLEYGKLIKYRVLLDKNLIEIR